VRATLGLGVAASVVANVLHAQPHPISQAIAAWPPLALLLTVELISRVPVHRRSLAFARLAATATIAGIAAWVSYWHMAGVAARYGETGASPFLLPLSVDGLIIVASICLVELGGRIAAAESTGAATRTARTTSAIAAPDLAAPDFSVPEPTPLRGATARRRTPAGRTPAKVARSKSTASKSTAALRPPRQASPRPRRPVAETAALAAEIEATRPDATEADVAQQLGITTARLRAVRRQAADLPLAA
jgi:hypothetical protein